MPRAPLETELSSPPLLGARQQRFVDEYMVDLNATRAAVAAGYSKRTAAQAGWEVLRNPKVAAEIGRRQQELAVQKEVNAARIVEELAKLAFANLGDFYRVGADGTLELDVEALADPAKAAALAQIDITEKPNGTRVTKIRLADKRAALVDLGKHLGLFNDGAMPNAAVTNPREHHNEEPDVRRLALAAIALIRDAGADGAAPNQPALLERPIRPRVAEDILEL